MKMTRFNWYLALLITAVLALAGCKSDSSGSDGGTVGGDISEHGWRWHSGH